MVYLPTGSSDLLLILGCMTPTSCTGTFPLCILVLYGELTADMSAGACEYASEHAQEFSSGFRVLSL